MIKKIKYIMFLLIFSLALVSCTSTEYKGGFPELYSVAVNSVLGNIGHEEHSDSIIEIIEKDSFGRILFSYTEERTIFSILIIQKYDEYFSYFYEDYNLLSKAFERGNNEFSIEDINNLKDINDWNKEIDEDRLIKVKIQTKKQQPKLSFSESQFEEIFKKIARLNGYKGDDAIFRSSAYLTSDKFGRLLYHAWGIGRDVNGDGVSLNSDYVRFDIVLIFNPDGSYNADNFVMQIENLYTYQDTLKEFKNLNRWNKELEV